jgi:hypothetical protein
MVLFLAIFSGHLFVGADPPASVQATVKPEEKSTPLPTGEPWGELVGMIVEHTPGKRVWRFCSRPSTGWTTSERSFGDIVGPRTTWMACDGYNDRLFVSSLRSDLGFRFIGIGIHWTKYLNSGTSLHWDFEFTAERIRVVHRIAWWPFDLFELNFGWDLWNAEPVFRYGLYAD